MTRSRQPASSSWCPSTSRSSLLFSVSLWHANFLHIAPLPEGPVAVAASRSASVLISEKDISLEPDEAVFGGPRQREPAHGHQVNFVPAGMTKITSAPSHQQRVDRENKSTRFATHAQEQQEHVAKERMKREAAPPAAEAKVLETSRKKKNARDDVALEGGSMRMSMRPEDKVNLNVLHDEDHDRRTEKSNGHAQGRPQGEGQAALQDRPELARRPRNVAHEPEVDGEEQDQVHENERERDDAAAKRLAAEALVVPSSLYNAVFVPVGDNLRSLFSIFDDTEYGATAALRYVGTLWLRRIHFCWCVYGVFFVLTSFCSRARKKRQEEEAAERRERKREEALHAWDRLLPGVITPGRRGGNSSWTSSSTRNTRRAGTGTAFWPEEELPAVDVSFGGSMYNYYDDETPPV
mmetsp:Transcript_27792/g.70197  ORF Transcript_27792/g.70197 Transcript_27792/m.70197 type:complete len:408 (+) Transcript_27792:65-1288(+)